ncbi:flagellar hook-associated protein FlgK [Paenisporosarcina cavernae]|uniref:Flagellar hook-associated protein 1 n=1 Tax=Paenisporosarcina cavernae TaxID=2320858 RepID=A0A385YR28_9BACL|nr:flagellar hook-associated protein FlgK [Paenisporosarcina cavernae]AYC28941.1 flagellar hook-associated protein FlgK [Paenisporosarcina cavernae]
MRSTFMGLEASKRGLFTQQSALYTTGHNIANANTQGYSRQRVNMQPTLGYPGTGLNAPKTAGFIGTGVEAHSVQRIRDGFIDRQYRQETNKLGYWESRSQAITQMEDILSEPSEFGLNESLNQFWKSLQDLSTNPENAGARKVVIQRGTAVAESFNYIHTQLSDIQANIKNELRVSTKDINSMLEQIASLNGQIAAIEPNGYMPNDLYDARDNLLDELSEYFPLEISYDKSGGGALDIAEGIVNVSIQTKTGAIAVVAGKDFSEMTTSLTSTETYEDYGQITFSSVGNATGGNYAYSDMPINKGKILSLIDSYGRGPAGAEVGYYPSMLENLNDMAKAFADEFNSVHQSGFSLPDELTGNSSTGLNFFEDGSGGTAITAANIIVANNLLTNPSLVAASNANAEEGNGQNALDLSNTKFTQLTVGTTTNTTVQTFYQSIIGQLGVDGEQANRLTYNSETIKMAVANNKASVSAVSLDEEMTNMITFQQAYNASARMITVVDETLDKIINGMGRVGI